MDHHAMTGQRLDRMIQPLNTVPVKAERLPVSCPMQVSPAALIGIWGNELREVDVQCRMLDPQGEGIIEQFNLQTFLGCRLWVRFGMSKGLVCNARRGPGDEH